MASKKGFDPLASLFDGPDLRDFNEPPSEEVPRPPEGTDPFLSMRATGPLHALRGEDWDAPLFGDERTPALPEDIGDTQDTLLMQRPPELYPPDEDTLMTPRPEDMHEELQPPMATASIASRAREPLTEHTQVDKAELARALAKAAMAAAPAARSVPQQEPTPATEEHSKADLAKALAKAALARAGQPVSVPKRVVPPPSLALPDMSLPAPPEPEQKPTRKRRAKAGLAARATRPMSALEAAAAAAKAEDTRRTARGPELVRLCSAIVRHEFRGSKKLAVVNAIPMDDRPLLSALWKGHRATFASRGDLSSVLATTTVIMALERAKPGALVAAIIETETSDYLAWVDMASERVLAAFPDARAWYAQTRT